MNNVCTSTTYCPQGPRPSSQAYYADTFEDGVLEGSHIEVLLSARRGAGERVCRFVADGRELRGTVGRDGVMRAWVHRVGPAHWLWKSRPHGVRLSHSEELRAREWNETVELPRDFAVWVGPPSDGFPDTIVYGVAPFGRWTECGPRERHTWCRVGGHTLCRQDPGHPPPARYEDRSGYGVSRLTRAT